MSTLRALNNTIMFKFLDETSGAKGRFTDTIPGSILVAVPTTTGQKVHRWGEVLLIGPLVDDTLKVGDYILIESLMWMEGTVVEGQKMWKTDDTKVLAVTSDIKECTRQ